MYPPPPSKSTPPHPLHTSTLPPAKYQKSLIPHHLTLIKDFKLKKHYQYVRINTIDEAVVELLKLAQQDLVYYLQLDASSTL